VEGEELPVERLGLGKAPVREVEPGQPGQGSHVLRVLGGQLPLGDRQGSLQELAGGGIVAQVSADGAQVQERLGELRKPGAASLGRLTDRLAPISRSHLFTKRLVVRHEWRSDVS
jgi:hypothetical protein